MTATRRSEGPAPVFAAPVWQQPTRAPHAALPNPRMHRFEDHRRELTSFPPALRALLEAELAAGNAITGIGQWFPAAPTGAFVMLARPVSTRPANAADGLRFHESHSPLYSGVFTDAAGRHLILNPPAPDRRGSKPIPGDGPRNGPAQGESPGSWTQLQPSQVTVS